MTHPHRKRKRCCLLTEALTRTERTGERSYERELHRLKGELLPTGLPSVILRRPKRAFAKPSTAREMGARALPAALA